MRYEEGDYEASHPSPVWRARANYILAAHIGVKEGRNEWEQIWGEETGPNKYIICCIPFFASDISLGDEVETDSDSVIKEVTKQSGQTTFRVWFGDQKTESRDNTASEIKKLGVMLEWSSENLLAVSVSRDGAQKVADFLDQQERDGRLQYETGAASRTES